MKKSLIFAQHIGEDINWEWVNIVKRYFRDVKVNPFKEWNIEYLLHLMGLVFQMDRRLFER